MTRIGAGARVGGVDPGDAGGRRAPPLSDDGAFSRPAGRGAAGHARCRPGGLGHAWLRAREQSFRPVAMVSVFDREAWLVAISRENPPPPIRIADRESLLVPAHGEARLREAVESANRAKSEFLATMSHEIRAPMSGGQRRRRGAAAPGR